MTESHAPIPTRTPSSTNATSGTTSGSTSSSASSQRSAAAALNAAITRRTALQTSAALGAAAAATVAGAGGFGTWATPIAAAQDPGGSHAVFQHGVASGDPLASGVLIWTRVTSHPEDAPGAEQGHPTRVAWEVAADPDFARIVTQGTVTAVPASDMTVKVEAAGLAPYTGYWYRFRVVDGPYAGQVSPVGRTRTAPAAGQMVGELRFALMSCANWEAGFFHAYGDMAGRGDIDYALCVGDYIYEYPRGEYTGKTGAVRHHNPAHEIVSLRDYRERYGQYRTDPHLQAAHAACPWIVTWDDHEIANDAWAGGAENHSAAEGDYHARRAAAIQAYVEWLPIRAVPFSAGGHIYRNLSFGALAELSMLDLRTYRNAPVSFTNSGGSDDPQRSMLGSEQFTWLSGKLRSSQARWNLIGNSVMFSPVLIPPLDPPTTEAVTQLLGLPAQGMPYNFDQWDGYAAERRALIELLRAHDIRNTVWLTGDIHSSWATDIPLEPATYPASGHIAAEIVCPSITSSNIDDILKLPENNPLSQTAEQAFPAINRHIRWVELDSHGYTVVQVLPEEINADWIFLTADAKLRPHNPGFYYARSARVRRGEPIALHGNQIDPATHRV